MSCAPPLRVLRAARAQVHTGGRARLRPGRTGGPVPRAPPVPAASSSR
ncbi:hypothetical protein SLNWT_3497 [Streptomyces albus]|uniref:Uncharacterized protein n=1 Tax=Streptomyces albus (strain ATCC 21838 / DSM 41398 / FERM P-419 / JCM 4703 / NBRC 107858) TaxID=1081613 RepID=A0A0B5EMX4_STRA4|nr:hypothetical protein SLNWT_3497 [Streptomyces albus]AOU78177.1 hypothetical protein SLNHY_3486 [Streptomyces albus]